MDKNLTLTPIAHIENALPSKFGTPRQSGLVPELISRIVFEPGFRDVNEIRGLEGFSHIWLIWGFHLNRNTGWNPTVRPPRLGGNERIGVFATRSPYRPNPIGLSCVKLERMETDGGFPCLVVSGADLTDGTPIFDIKPYLPFTDSRPDARAGYVDTRPRVQLEISDPGNLLSVFTEDDRKVLHGLLAQDPRPAYQSDPGTVYGMHYGKWDVRFRAEENAVIVLSIDPEDAKPVK